MSTAPLKVLVVGATGSIGRLVVDEAIRQGHAVRDAPNMPLAQEPERVREDLRRLVAPKACEV